MSARSSGPVVVIVGTRPELIKVSPLFRQANLDLELVTTQQHYDAGLHDSFISELGMPEPAQRLSVGGGSRLSQMHEALRGLESVLSRMSPRMVLVQGDTTSALAGGLAANLSDICLGHIEAGLRSFDRRMPEEHNRVALDHLADRLYAPTERARCQLQNEGIPNERIVLTGNTVVDAVLQLVPTGDDVQSFLGSAGILSPFGVLTLHRPENSDDPQRLQQLLEAVGATGIGWYFPAHPRTEKVIRDEGLSVPTNIQRVPPVGYRVMLAALQAASVIATDSGGIQEEAAILGRPVIVIRRSTERQETLALGGVLVEDPSRLTEVIVQMREETITAGAVMERSVYGDGRASDRIAADIMSELGAST